MPLLFSNEHCCEFVDHASLALWDGDQLARVDGVSSNTTGLDMAGGTQALVIKGSE